MANVKAARVTVATTATRLDQDVAGTNSTALVIRNRGGTAVYVGGTDVTTANGFQLDTGESITMDDLVRAGVYGIVAAGTEVCHVLQVGP
jgi:hypothetical protein